MSSDKKQSIIPPLPIDIHHEATAQPGEFSFVGLFDDHDDGALKIAMMNTITTQHSGQHVNISTLPSQLHLNTKPTLAHPPNLKSIPKPTIIRPQNHQPPSHTMLHARL